MTDPHDKLQRLRRAMAEQDIDLLITLKPEHSYYLGGFNPIIYSHPVVALLPREGEPRLLVHALRDDHARASTALEHIHLYGAWSTKVTMGPDWLQALATIVAELGLERARIGVEEEFLTVQRQRQLAQALPQARWADSSKLFFEARMLKSAAEIADARIAADLANVGMDAAVRALREGGSEREIALASQAAMGRHWNERYPEVEVADFGSLEGGVFHGLQTWVLSGERMFVNADVPTTRRPQPGELSSILIWTSANGTHAEIERTVARGAIPDSHRHALDTIFELREALRPLLRPGTPIAELFQAAKAGLERRGYPRNIPGRIGHGIGLGAHEALSLDAHSPYVLEPGMLITFEPNLRVPPVCGTQISDTVLISADGHEFLTGGHDGFVQA
ncbi:aminopeptidase P family protein [Xanthomonas sp. AmX2]|uniref:M24 family metallopeptidase n=1 Tax=Xanthomonas sp. TaxID=29446 RepID=UPI00197E0B60|nr:Xaa-Pro peptidase family protein [Xanthomonas sp.]MBN6151871.1 aminopeptidase P family protein [Xanthomonas sp.]